MAAWSAVWCSGVAIRNAELRRCPMGPLERLLAIEDIKALKARRCRSVDEKDWDLYRACHTADAKSYALGTADAPVVGAEAMAESVRKATEGHVTVHHVHSPEIVFTSESTAEGTWAMEDRHWWQENGHASWLRGFGRYFETYEKIDGNWLISSRRLVRSHVDTGIEALP
jgi:hypothetical protein